MKQNSHTISEFWCCDCHRFVVLVLVVTVILLVVFMVVVTVTAFVPSMAVVTFIAFAPSIAVATVVFPVIVVIVPGVMVLRQ